MYPTMARPTKKDPDRGDARRRLLEAARDLIRAQGYGGTSVEMLCRAAGVTKGAFFHHFPSKEALGVAAACDWAESTGAFFAGAPYHLPGDPMDRILAYVAFRRAIISDDLTTSSCLAGTLVQETHAEFPAIRDACGAAILGHAATLEPDFQAALAARGMTTPTAQSLAQHTQTVIQGAFVMAKAAGNAALAREALDHLDRYLRLLLGVPP
jgi:TetR/AcrR family transcriptional repressor of nem operon